MRAVLCRFSLARKPSTGGDCLYIVRWRDFDFANMGLLDIRLAAATRISLPAVEPPSGPCGALGSVAFYFFFASLCFAVAALAIFSSQGSPF
jgi:hypothetical protein